MKCLGIVRVLTQLYSVAALCTPRSLSTSAAVAAANARAASVLAERRRGVSTTAALSTPTSAAAVAAAVKEANHRAAEHLQKRKVAHILRHAAAPESGTPAPAPVPAPAPASTQQGENLCVLDGHAIAYRMFHGMKSTDMKTADGTPTYAINGFCNALLKMRELFPGYRMLVAFDSRAPTFRSELLPEYKANRPAMPEPMRVQMPRILEACTAFGVPQARPH